MAEKLVGEWTSSQAAGGVDHPLSPGAEARFTRRLAVLLGVVPLPEMTQAETDWVFAQRVRLAGDD
jgi:hypothetical protein